MKNRFLSYAVPISAAMILAVIVAETIVKYAGRDTLALVGMALIGFAILGAIVGALISRHVE